MKHRKSGCPKISAGLFLTSLLGLLLLTSCLEKTEERSPYPDIKFEKTVYNFGEIYQGEKVDYTYEFKNNGVDTLRIAKVRKGCGCQAAEATRKVIPPGEKGGIKVTFDSKGYSGKVSKRVYVHSNDPEEEKVNLLMEGTIVVEILVRPKTINFTEISIGVGKSMKAYIIPKNLETLEIKNMETSSDYITVTTSDYIEQGKKGFELEVTISPEAPAGTMVEKIKISTNSEKQPLIEIQVYARISDRIVITPKTLHMRAKPGDTKSFTISVFKANRKNFRITKIEDDLADIDTEFFFLREEEDRQIYQIKMRIKGTAATGVPKGSLILYTNDPKQTTILLRLSGMIQQERFYE